MLVVDQLKLNNWHLGEFADIDLGDERLNKRFFNISGGLSALPSASINQASSNWAEAKASYRFFGNSNVSSESILEPHIHKTTERIKNEELVLAIQDTTTLNFSKHIATKDLGNIGSNQYSEILGLNVHTTLSLSLEGVPLGITSQKIWTRGAKVKDHSTRPIKEKESWRWIEALRLTKEIEEESGTKIITVADRESDIFEFLVDAEDIGASYVIRSRIDRSLFGEPRSSAPKFTDYFEEIPSMGVYQVDVPNGRDIQNKRTVLLDVKYDQVCIRPPYHRVGRQTDEMPPLVINIIKATEINSPEGNYPIEWVLLTNCEVSTFEDAIEKIKWYSMRWPIEVYHKIMKSGLKIEESRLNDSKKLTRYTTLCCILAWRIYLLTNYSRFNPEASSSEFLTEAEWKSLYCFIMKKSKAQKHPPSIGEATKWIARLGGYLARNSDPPPGVTVMWRGLERLSDISNTWALLN